MKVQELQERLTSSLPPLFRCDDFGNDRFRVRTPLLFPNGDVIDVFVARTAESYTVTDYGDAAGWLDLRAPQKRRSAKQRGLIADTCQTLGISLEGEEMILQGVSQQELADSIVRMAQAEARVGDVWFTMRHALRDERTAPQASEVSDSRARGATAREVDSWLRQRRLDVEPNYQIKGNSQRTWSVDFRTSSPTRESFVFVLRASRKQRARDRLYEVATACLDLRELGQVNNSQRNLISLFDDTNGAWSTEDFNLLSIQSNVALWSQPGKLEELLAVES